MLINLDLKKFANVLVFTLFISLFSITSVVAADIDIINPSSNSKVSGSVNVQWSVFAANNAGVPYELSLKDSSCGGSGVAIASGGFSQTIKNGYYNLDWNSESVSDGQKCMQLCIQNDGNLECTQKRFSVLNQGNNPPVITSSPSKLNFFTGEVFEYRVAGFDPDGDQFIYRLDSAPNFVYMDQSGFITFTNPAPAGNHNITVSLVDELGKTASQTFTLNFSVRPQPTSAPNVTTQPTATPSGNGGSSNSDGGDNGADVAPTLTPVPTEQAKLQKQINFLLPRSGATFRGANNKIEWEFESFEADLDYETIIGFQSDSQDFREIIKYDSLSTKPVFWDVSDVENGTYDIIIRVNEGNNLYSDAVFENILVENRGDEDSILTIYDLQPDNQEEITDLLPTISAKYEPSGQGRILLGEVEVRLNNANITETCSVNETDLSCQIDEDLEFGDQTISVKVADSNGQSQELVWVFSIVEDTQTDTGEELTDGGETATSNDNGGLFDDFELPEIDFQSLVPYCGGGLFILLLILVISVLRRRSGNKQSAAGYGVENNTNFQTTEDDPFTPSNSDSFQDFGDPEAPDAADEFDFSVGSHSIEPEEEEQLLSQVQAKLEEKPEAGEFSDVVAAPDSNSSVVETPSPSENSQPPAPQSDDDLPDWLKGDSDAGAEPVSPSGDTSSNKKGQDGSSVHGEFDLTPTD